MKLRDAAKVLRSKNAGPLTVTLDMLFETQARYDLAAQSPSLAPGALAAVYGVPAADVQVIRVPLALAIKVVLPRPIVAGSPGDRDVYGAQQHRPLLEIEL
jgi:Domain of unknown function (DUF4387)